MTDGGDAITCSSCLACCCRLEVMLMGDDDVPAELTQRDPWGGEVMAARLADGWCAALDRHTLLCTIYQRRPAICGDYQAGDYECLQQRLQLIPARIESHAASRTSKEYPLT